MGSGAVKNTPAHFTRRVRPRHSRLDDRRQRANVLAPSTEPFVPYDQQQPEKERNAQNTEANRHLSWWVGLPCSLTPRDSGFQTTIFFVFKGGIEVTTTVRMSRPIDIMIYRDPQRKPQRALHPHHQVGLQNQKGSRDCSKQSSEPFVISKLLYLTGIDNFP